jgi:hypothetical protein
MGRGKKKAGSQMQMHMVAVDLRVGDEVQIMGLSKSKHHNGKIGVVSELLSPMKHPSTGPATVIWTRVAVNLGEGTVLSVRTENLKPVEGKVLILFIFIHLPYPHPSSFILRFLDIERKTHGRSEFRKRGGEGNNCGVSSKFKTTN